MMIRKVAVRLARVEIRRKGTGRGGDKETKRLKICVEFLCA
jgi:hypothetical protein